MPKINQEEYESKEAEVKKDREWAQKEIDRYLSYEGVNEARNALVFAKGVINQLDEPEVLLQEWIEDNEFLVNDESGVGYTVIESRKLKGLLVPEQELPVIPKFVAEWIEHNKESGDIHTATNLNSIHAEIFYKEIYKKQSVELQETIARAWLDGYTVEEEQKYNVKFKVKSSFGTVGIFLYKKGDEVLAGDNFKAYYPKEDECRLTEQEIRSFQNGDVLFEHFAVKVKELEE